MPEQVGQHDAVFIGGAGDVGGQTPVLHHFRTVEEGSFDVGVADVKGENHIFPPKRE